jgi:hypothetical protein
MQTHRAIAKIEPETGFTSAGSVHGFSPLSPRTFQVRHIPASCLKKIIEKDGYSWQDLVVSDAMKDAISSPTLTLQMNYASPIMDIQTPNFSPVTLPRPGRIVEEVWAARDVTRFPYIVAFLLTDEPADRISKRHFLARHRSHLT